MKFFPLPLLHSWFWDEKLVLSNGLFKGNTLHSLAQRVAAAEHVHGTSLHSLIVVSVSRLAAASEPLLSTQSLSVSSSTDAVMIGVDVYSEVSAEGDEYQPFLGVVGNDAVHFFNRGQCSIFITLLTS